MNNNGCEQGTCQGPPVRRLRKCDCIVSSAGGAKYVVHVVVLSLDTRTYLYSAAEALVPILEAEAYLEPTKKRLDREVIAHTVKLMC
jgi:hypothetical protein